MRTFTTLFIVAGLAFGGAGTDLYTTLTGSAYCTAVAEAQAEVPTCDTTPVAE